MAKKLRFEVYLVWGEPNQWEWSVCGPAFNLMNKSTYTRKSDARRGMVRAMRRIGIAYDNAEDLSI